MYRRYNKYSDRFLEFLSQHQIEHGVLVPTRKTLTFYEYIYFYAVNSEYAVRRKIALGDR